MNVTYGLQQKSLIWSVGKTIYIIVIIMWLVRYWTLLFLQACSRTDESVLDDRRLPDQCWVVLDRIQQSAEPGVMWSAQSAVPVPWQRGHTGPKGSTETIYSVILTILLVLYSNLVSVEEQCLTLTWSTSRMITSGLARQPVMWIWKYKVFLKWSVCTFLL